MAIKTIAGRIKNDFIPDTVASIHCMHYSDTNKYIRDINTGYEFVVAVDLLPCIHTYEETDEVIEEL